MAIKPTLESTQLALTQASHPKTQTQTSGCKRLRETNDVAIKALQSKVSTPAPQTSISNDEESQPLTVLFAERTPIWPSAGSPPLLISSGGDSPFPIGSPPLPLCNPPTTPQAFTKSEYDTIAKAIKKVENAIKKSLKKEGMAINPTQTDLNQASNPQHKRLRKTTNNVAIEALQGPPLTVAFAERAPNCPFTGSSPPPLIFTPCSDVRVTGMDPEQEVSETVLPADGTRLVRNSSLEDRTIPFPIGSPLPALFSESAQR